MKRDFRGGFDIRESEFPRNGPPANSERNLYELNSFRILKICKMPFLFTEEANPWMTDDRDYTYDELLLRVFAIMRDKNPEMVAGEKKKFVMRPPQVVRVGTKKTAFVNFTEIAKM